MHQRMPCLGVAAMQLLRLWLLRGRLRGACVLLWGSQVLGRRCILLHERLLQHRRQRLLQVLLQRHLVGAAILAALALPKVLQIRAGCNLMRMQNPTAPANSMHRQQWSAACQDATRQRTLGRCLSFLAKYRPHALHRGCPVCLSLRQKGVLDEPQLLHTCAQHGALSVTSGREKGRDHPQEEGKIHVSFM
jgi:hypothetical protein